MKKYSTHIVWAVIAIVALAGGFFWGKSAVAARGAGSFAGGAASGTRGGFGGVARGGAAGGFVTGQITANDGTSLTVQLANGNSENVFYSSSTPVIKPSPASASDLTTGTMVMIGGTTNSDGSVTAQSIQIRQANATPGAGRPAGQ
jgi:hypothetical protein